MNPGLLNKRITFQLQPEEPQTNENGFPIEVWNDVKTVWTKIETPSDRTSSAEFYEAASTYAKNTLTFVIRYTTGIHSDMRIKYKDRYFEIVNSPINDNEANKTLTIIGREVI